MPKKLDDSFQISEKLFYKNKFGLQTKFLNLDITLVLIKQARSYKRLSHLIFNLYLFLLRQLKTILYFLIISTASRKTEISSFLLNPFFKISLVFLNLKTLFLLNKNNV